MGNNSAGEVCALRHNSNGEAHSRGRQVGSDRAGAARITVTACNCLTPTATDRSRHDESVSMQATISSANNNHRRARRRSTSVLLRFKAG